MGKGLGVILLVIGLILLYLASGNMESAIDLFDLSSSGIGYVALTQAYIGIIFSIIGLLMMLFSRPKQPPLFR